MQVIWLTPDRQAIRVLHNSKGYPRCVFTLFFLDDKMRTIFHHNLGRLDPMVRGLLTTVGAKEDITLGIRVALTFPWMLGT